MQVANHFQGKRTYSEQSIFYLGVDSEVIMALSKDRRSIFCDLLDISAIYTEIQQLTS